MPYQPHTLEPRWQRYWEEEQTFVAREDPSRPKFYALDMFPYPSGKGLHVGHPAGYTASDVVCRYKWACGFNVLHPMGFDSFGLPAEQKAIEEGVPPQQSTAEAIETFRGQLKRLGYCYDWTRELSTCDPGYYRWTQVIFTRLLQQGLAYQADALVNWCPGLGTVLANDEVLDGKSERGGHPVERIQMRQWMLRITAFAERLLAGLDTIDWPESTCLRQRDWIGKSEGARVSFPVEGRPETLLEVFTTRPDTLYGVTFLALAPEHPLCAELATAAQRPAVEAYQAQARARSEKDRQASRQKTGVDTGARAVHPLTGQPVPIWTADCVLPGYGTGAVMGVPGHDERDWAFARGMGLPIVEVISGGDLAAGAWTGEGQLVRSGPFDGTPTAGGEAARAVTAHLEQRGLGRREVTYRFRDWIFARQRYWGEPIPVLKDGPQVVRALDLDELPLELPAVERYQPLGDGRSPLAAVRSWVEVQDPKTGRRLERETDTMPGSAGSSWYFLRYCDPHNDRELCSREKSDYWMPVDLYVGGPEHAVGHLLYARMWQKFLKDQGLVRDEEPFQKLVHQGMILGLIYRTPDQRLVPLDQVEERDGQAYQKGTGVELSVEVGKMSKRYGNVVNPDDVIRLYGADALRIYICFMGPLTADKPWQTSGMEGQFSWLKRTWRLYFDGAADAPRVSNAEPTGAEVRALHRAIQKVTADIEALSLNTAVSALHVATRDLAALGTTSRAVLEPLCQLLAPFAPHFAEEIWRQALGHAESVVHAPWPKADARWTTEETVTVGVQVNGKLRGEIALPRDADQASALAAACAHPNIARHLGTQAPRVVAYKPGRILSLRTE
jgi:leucyl-tRNA synthetase